MKGESGRHLTTNPPFGYVKDEQNKDKWLIDEEAAKTVRYIFKLCCDGLGPTQIANRLRREQVLTPTAYKIQQRGELLPERPFLWAQKIVSGILDKVEYLGHTENFKTASKNYRNKKRLKTAKEERKLFRDTHPAIVDEHTFQVVQEIRSYRHRPTATGKVSIFSGKVFCADCGAKLQYNTTNSFSANQDFFNCGNYRSNTGTCTAHFIRAVTLEKIVLAHMKRVLAYVQQFERYIKYFVAAPCLRPPSFFYSMFCPSSPKKRSIQAAVSAARATVSISQNTRSRGSVPEKREISQPPFLKYTLQPSA